MLAILLVGCGSSWEVDTGVVGGLPAPTVELIAPDDAFSGAPVAGWDPWRVRWDDRAARAPVVIREDGLQAPLTSVIDADTWAPTPMLPEGTHTATAGEDAWDISVGEWGQVEGFDPTVLEGRSWRLVRLGVASAAMEDLLFGQLATFGLTLSIPVVEGDAVDVQLWSTEDPACQVFGAVGTIDRRGRFTWNSDSLTINADPEPIRVWDVSLVGGADTTGDTLGGVAMHMVLDTAPIAVQMSDTQDPEYICQVAAGFGMACTTCPDGSADTCLALDVTGGQFEEVAFNPGSDPQMCGVDLEALPDAPQLDCDLDTDFNLDLCSLVAFPFTGATLSVALRRRRRKR